MSIIHKGNKIASNAVTGDTLPIGSQIPFSSLTIPDNWLLCDGSAISRVDYSELFAVIGTSYGAGNGTTTFNLPNKKGRTSVGYDSSQTEFDTIGETGGAKTQALTVANLPAMGFTTGHLAYSDSLWTGINITHNHNIGNGTAGTNDEGTRGNINNGAWHKYTWGSNTAHNNLQPYETDVWIIKAKQSSGVVATVVDDLDSTSPTDALSANMGRELNDKINKQKGFNCHQWSNTVVATTSNANFTDFPGTPTLSFTMSKKGSIVIRASAVVYVTNRTVALTVLLDSTDITSSNCITNCTNTLGETLNLVLKVENVNEGTHSIKLRWRVQNSSDVGTALPYKNSTLEVQEI